MASLVLSLLSLLFCVKAQHSLRLAGGQETKPLNFFALGDWGGLPYGTFNYSTTVERAVADQMGRLADELKPSFVIALGMVSACFQYFL